MSRVRKLVSFGLLTLGLLLGGQNILAGQATAAGSVVVSVEPSLASVNTGENLELRFYATPSGANLWGVSVQVALSQLSFVSFDSTGAPFNGFSGVPYGGTAGSTNFEVVGSYQGQHTGSTGKIYLGKVVVAAASSAGTGTVTLSGVIAYSNYQQDPMSSSASGTTITISAPSSSNPPAACGAGQTGTPPNCVTPSQPASNSNPALSPNSSSKITVPSSTSVSSEASGEVVSEREVSDVLAATTSAEEETNAEDKKGPSLVPYVLLGAGGLMVIAGILCTVLLARKHRTKPQENVVGSEDNKDRFISG